MNNTNTSLRFSDEHISKYDYVISKAIKGLAKYNNLAMTKEDLMQHGRILVMEALEKYHTQKIKEEAMKNAEKEGKKFIPCSESTFVYRHLFFRFGNLFHRSITIHSIADKTDAYKSLKEDQERKNEANKERSGRLVCDVEKDQEYYKSTYTKNQGQNVDIDDVSGILQHIVLGNSEKTIEFQQLIDSVGKKDGEFKSSWDSWNTINQDLFKINKLSQSDNPDDSETINKIDSHLQKLIDKRSFLKLKTVKEKITKLLGQYTVLERKICTGLLSEAYYKRIIPHGLIENLLLELRGTDEEVESNGYELNNKLREDLKCQLEW